MVIDHNINPQRMAENRASPAPISEGVFERAAVFPVICRVGGC
jgi:hypothetical protein